MIAFPPYSPPGVYRRERPPKDWLQDETNGISNRELALEEMMMLWLSNANPTNDALPWNCLMIRIWRSEPSIPIFPRSSTFFAGQPGSAPRGQTLLYLLRAPALAAPHSRPQWSSSGQRWGLALSQYPIACSAA